MAERADNGAGRGGGAPNRGWRRLALAGPISVLLHLVILVLAQPEYSPVSDFAVEMEVLEMTPGEPGAPPPPPEPEPEEPPPEDPPEHEVAPDPTPEPDAPADDVGQLVDSMPDAGPPVADAVDAGPALSYAPDAGPETGSGTAPDGGVGQGSGICFHDLFPYGEDESRWVLWLSMKSFRGTAYQRVLGRTLSSFALYKKMAGATGMSPEDEVEGLLVTASDVFDWRTFRVVATYDSGEEKLRSKLIANRGATPGFEVTRTETGYEAAVPGSFRWHLVGSGRVLAVTHEKPGPGGMPHRDPMAAPPPPDNPYADPLDAGPRFTASGNPLPVDAGVEPSPKLPAPTFPTWPRQVTCMTRVLPISTDDVRDPPLGKLARAHLEPDDEGHWPVALLATRDPRAVGLHNISGYSVRFRYAVARAYFTDPIHIRGRIVFSGRGEEVAHVETAWQRIIRAARSDPFLAMAGLRGVFEGLELESVGNEIRFDLPLTESQIQAALLFIQLQGEALEKRTLRKETQKTPRSPSGQKK